MKKRISDLRINEEAIVSKINCSSEAVKRRLLDMGLTVGVKVKLVRIAPLGDPITIELRGYKLSIRLSEANNIEITEEKELSV